MSPGLAPASHGQLPQPPPLQPRKCTYRAWSLLPRAPGVWGSGSSPLGSHALSSIEVSKGATTTLSGFLETSTASERTALSSSGRQVDRKAVRDLRGDR